MRPRVAGLLVGPLCLLATVACGGGASEDPGLGAAPGFAPTTTSTTAPPQLTGAALDGRSFATEEIDGYDLVDGTDLRMTFANGLLTAYAGCSSMVAPYELESGRLSWRASPVVASAMCLGDRRLQDLWVRDRLLEGVEASLVGGQLRLRTDDLSTDLDQIGEVQAPEDADGAALLDTRWVLVRAIGTDGPLEIPSGAAAPTLRISSNSVADIFTGCNQGTAPVVIERGGSSIEFGEIAITDVSCGERETALEERVAAVLDGPTGSAVSGRRLTITKGEDVLIYEAA